MSDIFNTIDRKTWREIKETLQWPPMENQLVVYTHLCRRLGPVDGRREVGQAEEEAAAHQPDEAEADGPRPVDPVGETGNG